MKKFIIFCSIIIGAACSQLAQSIDSCPKVKPMENFNSFHTALFKTWYGRLESSSNFPGYDKCNFLYIAPNGPDEWSSIFSGVSNKTGIRKSVTATTKINKQNPGVISVRYHLPDPFTISVAVLDTDYYNYIVFWSCREDQPQKTLGFWILVKNQSSDYDLRGIVRSSMNEIGVNLTMNSIDQVNCS